MKVAKLDIYEGVLNDDYIEKFEDGTYKITYYEFCTPWTNTKCEMESKDLEKLINVYGNITNKLNVPQDNLGYETTLDAIRDIDYIEYTEK